MSAPSRNEARDCAVLRAFRKPVSQGGKQSARGNKPTQPGCKNSSLTALPPPSPLPREGRKPPEARAAGTLVWDGSAACQVRLGLRTLHLPWNLETRASASYHHSATWYPLINGAIRPRRPESVYVKDCSTPGQHKMLSPKSSLEVFLIFYSSGRSWYFVIFPSVCNAPKS